MDLLMAEGGPSWRPVRQARPFPVGRALPLGACGVAVLQDLYNCTVGRWQWVSRRRDSARHEVMWQYLRSSASGRTSRAAAHSGTRRDVRQRRAPRPHFDGSRRISPESAHTKVIFRAILPGDVYSQKCRLLFAIVAPQSYQTWLSLSSGRHMPRRPTSSSFSRTCLAMGSRQSS